MIGKKAHFVRRLRGVFGKNCMNGRGRQTVSVVAQQRLPGSRHRVVLVEGA